MNSLGLGDREVLLTGIGLVSSLGEGVDATWAALEAIGAGDARANVDAVTRAPWYEHPIVPLELDRQIPRKGDQRQMEPWQRLGVYAAGLALDAAGLTGDASALARTDLLVAAGGGERDYAVDAALLADLAEITEAEQADALLNTRLLRDLRPTLFLAQLTNLLAGNISIVHGVVGSSRTLMGEEAAGAEALRIACARIAAGQGDLALVGAAYNAERPDAVLQYEFTGSLLRDRPFSGVWSRQAAGGGMVLGSIGCFLVLESRASLTARGGAPLARIAQVDTGRSGRAPGDITAALARLLNRARPFDAILSGASGAAMPTREEQAALRATGLPYRATASALGHAFEPSFLINVALAGCAVARGSLFGPLDAGESAGAEPVRRLAVTGIGHWRGEALAVLERAG